MTYVRASIHCVSSKQLFLFKFCIYMRPLIYLNQATTAYTQQHGCQWIPKIDGTATSLVPESQEFMD